MLPQQHSSCWISCRCSCGRLPSITVSSFLAGAIQLVCNQCKCPDSCHPGLSISIIRVILYLYSPQNSNQVCMKEASPVLTGPRLAQQHCMNMKACQPNVALLTLPVFRLSKGDSKMDFESTIAIGPFWSMRGVAFTVLNLCCSSQPCQDLAGKRFQQPHGQGAKRSCSPSSDRHIRVCQQP